MAAPPAEARGFWSCAIWEIRAAGQGRSWIYRLRTPDGRATLYVLDMIGDSKPEYRNRHDASPAARGVTFCGGSDRGTVDYQVAVLIHTLAFVPCRIRVKVDSQRRGQHRGGEVLRIFCAERARHSKTVMFRDIAIAIWVRGSRQTDAGMHQPAGFIGFRAGHDTKSDFAGLEGRDPRFPCDQLAVRWKNRRDRGEILLFDVGVPQGELEGCQKMLVDADAAGQEHAGRYREHGSLPR